MTNEHHIFETPMPLCQQLLSNIQHTMGSAFILSSGLLVLFRTHIPQSDFSQESSHIVQCNSVASILPLLDTENI